MDKKNKQILECDRWETTPGMIEVIKAGGEEESCNKQNKKDNTK